MNLKMVLENMIEEEISSFERTGNKLRLKSLRKRRITYTIIFGIILVVLVAMDHLLLAFIDMIIYYILMYNKANNVSVLKKLAERSPDTPIGEIIKGDMIIWQAAGVKKDQF